MLNIAKAVNHNTVFLYLWMCFWVCAQSTAFNTMDTYSMTEIRSKHIDPGRLFYFVMSNIGYVRWRCSVSYSEPLQKLYAFIHPSNFLPLLCLVLQTLPFSPLSIHACLTFPLFLPRLQNSLCKSCTCTHL